MSGCTNPTPVFVPSACGINQTQVYNDRTTRAAKKAIKSASIYAGQAQSSRVTTLKNCIAQVNASERAFNQVTRKTIRVRDIITYQTTETQYTTTEQSTAYNKTFRNQAQPLTQIIAFDPTGNLYSLLNTSSGTSVSKFALGDLSQNTVTGTTFAATEGTLITANLFWSSGTLVFVGVFYRVNTIIKIYTFDAALTATNRLSISLAGTKQYTGQSTYNTGNYIYVVLCPPLQFGFELAPIYYINQSNWTYLNPPTNMLLSFSSIQQAAGDTLGGAVVGSYSQSGIFITYLSGATVYWRNTLAIPSAESTPCATIVMNNVPVLTNPAGNYILAFFFDGANFQTQLFSYTSSGPTRLTANPQVEITWPFNNTPYAVQSMSLAYKVGQNTGEVRIFYTMYLYNPNVTNYEYYIQNGEMDAAGNIVSFTNIQIGSSYNISPSNNLAVSGNVTAVSSGEELITYATTFEKPFTAIITRQQPRDFCQTIIVYPGCDCPTVPANSLNPPVDGLTHTLQIAVCEPQTFTNPSAIVSCAPVNTPPTKFLTAAQGAEPPQGPARTSVTRRYYNIAGIDQICRPIPNRFSSSKTARIRAGIESASDTQYSTTVLPVVTYPFPCPVYGNQAGIPVASLCRPTIDGRPTNGVPS